MGNKDKHSEVYQSQLEKIAKWGSRGVTAIFAPIFAFEAIAFIVETPLLLGRLLATLARRAICRQTRTDR